MVYVVSWVGLALQMVIPALIVYRTSGRCSTAIVWVRYIIAVLAGYIILNLSSYASWETAFYMARNEKEWTDLAIRDGASQAFALVFGWVPVAIYVGLLALTRGMVRRFLSRNRREWGEDEF